ncbi:hypothetical protein NQD34_008325 [Periophthalmus magnuspinnatus]|nr:hypothetical protein NQD34_008325 [Periophthalmus magnuspinnatus]
MPNIPPPYRRSDRRPASHGNHTAPRSPPDARPRITHSPIELVHSHKQYTLSSACTAGEHEPQTPHPEVDQRSSSNKHTRSISAFSSQRSCSGPALHNYTPLQTQLVVTVMCHTGIAERASDVSKRG